MLGSSSFHHVRQFVRVAPHKPVSGDPGRLGGLFWPTGFAKGTDFMKTDVLEMILAHGLLPKEP